MSKKLISQFTDYLRTQQKARSTIVAYTKDLEQLHERSGHDLDTLATAKIKAVLDEMRQEFTAKTISRKINSYRTFYKFLQQQGIVDDNPATDIDHPKFTPRLPRVLSQMEHLALREVSRNNSRLYAMIELKLQSGLRIGELSRLKVNHLNLTDKDPYMEVIAYSTNPARVVPLNRKARETLADYLQQEKKQDSDPLFATRDGQHIIIRNIRSSIDRAMTKAGIENAAVNDLRNTFITAQLTAGVPLDYLAQVVGHKSTTTTAKYLDLIDSYQDNGIRKLVEV